MLVILHTKKSPFQILLLLLISILYNAKESRQGSHPVPYALSPVYLQYLENVETRFYNKLKENATTNIPLSANLKSYLADYEESVTTTSQKNGISETGIYENLHVSSNPILALQMINRFVKYFRKGRIYTILSEDFINTDALPSGNEVEDAMEALLRLQYFYDLDAHELSKGIIHGTYTNAHLTARECFELGKFSQESGYYTLALQWFDVTLYKLQAMNSESDVSIAGLKKDEVLKALQDTVDEHNEDYEESIEHGDMYSFRTPIYSTNYSDVAHLSMRKHLVNELTGRIYRVKDPKYNRAVEATMMALCEGKNLQSEKVKSRLKCFLDTSRHPYWRINPLRIEVLSDTPSIIQMYDVFSDAWISYLKNLSYSELERAPQPPEATPRTAAYAWFPDSAIPEIKVSKTVEFITGLNVAGKGAAEELQVAAYAFGAHVAPHHDSFYLGEEGEADDYAHSTTGNQVTTFLIYLSDVEKGGRTAFPLAGLSIKPVKNSAVLWYTKLRNGDVDNRTLHAACPVLKGHKWIATKWTRIGENIFKRPCGLTPDE